MALSGHFAATSFGVDTHDATVAETMIVNLKTRKATRSLRMDLGFPEFSKLVLTTTGAAAATWRTAGPDVVVVKVDAAGQAVLDRSPGIDPDSLALVGNRIYWTRDGLPQTAVLN